MPAPRPARPGDEAHRLRPTGGVGREVVTQALDAGHHVRAYVRNPAKLGLAHPNLTVTAGELTDREAVQRAVPGADAVISASARH